jgi:hypothetical protein
MRLGKLIRAVVTWSDTSGMTLRTENGGILTTSQIGIPIGTSVLVAYNHDQNMVKHVHLRDDGKREEYPDILEILEDIPDR